MSVFKPRTRIVSFRLSEEEYQHFRELSMAHGARSISGFARSVATESFESDSGSETAALRATMQELRRKIKKIDFEVKRLAQLVHSGSVVG